MLFDTRGFFKANFLAEGGFGSVHRGVLPNGQTFAVKQYKLASTQGDQEFCSEVEVLSCAQHRNVVMLIGFCIEDGRRYFWMGRSVIQMLMTASELIPREVESQKHGNRHVVDASTSVRVLCHKKDKEASQFLKLYYHLPALSDYDDESPLKDSGLKPPMMANFIRTTSLQWQERKLHVIDIPPPGPLPEGATADERAARTRDENAANDVACLMLTTMSAELQRQHVHIDAYTINKHLQNMFASQTRQERFNTSKSLFNCKQEASEPVGPHVLKMIGYIEYL
ncbi:hypothetical protein AgCh_035891 [Apium graveolens]